MLRSVSTCCIKRSLARRKASLSWRKSWSSCAAAPSCCGGAARGCYVLLHRYRELLRRSRQRCCVGVVANAEQLRRIDTVLGVKGEASGLHGPLDGGTGDIAGALRLH